MNQLSQTMTIKEVSDTLGVTTEAIKKHIRFLFPYLMVNGVETKLNQIQVTEIKKRMMPTTQVVGAVTELEMMEQGQRFFLWQQSRIDELKQKNKEQELLLEQAQPKIEFHDAVTESPDCFTMSETVKLLNLTIGRNKFYALLKADKILRDTKEPYQQYIEQGYFRTILKQVDHGGTEIVTLVTGKGLAWLQKKYDHIRLKEVV